MLVFRIHQAQDRLGTLRQVVYPYARGGAVTYTRPGQRPLGDRARGTRGGWWRGGAKLKAVLVEAGLPTAPSH